MKKNTLTKENKNLLFSANKSFISKIKSGHLGSLPVIIGLIIIFGVFGILNPAFLSANNIVNLLFDAAIAGVIALAIVCVLLLGEIDLSVGSISGASSAILGVVWVNYGLPIAFAIILAITFGAAVGVLYAFLRNKLGIPSFVSTLAGLLSFLGLQLYLLGSTGSINLPYGSPLVNFGQLMTMPDWLSYVLAFIPGVVLYTSNIIKNTKRNKMGLVTTPNYTTLLKSILLIILLELFVFYVNNDRGVPLLFIFFILLLLILQFILAKTKLGRHIYAVGGNIEAARRTGINVTMIYYFAFISCGVLASAGGILAASRLASASQQAGTGDVNLNAIAAAVIGGVSLFGGRGNAYSVLLGVLVISSIASGLTMLNLSSALRYIITGAVLVIAVIVDSTSRKLRVSSGNS